MSENKKRRISFPRALMIVLYASILLQTAALVIIVINTTLEQRQAVYRVMSSSSDQVLNFIETSLDEVGKYDGYYLTDADFLPLVNSAYMRSGTGKYAQAQVYIKGLMRRQLMMNPEVIGVTIYTKNGQLYDTTGMDGAYLAKLSHLRNMMEEQNLNTLRTEVQELSIHRRIHMGFVLTNRLVDLYTHRTVGFIHYAVGLRQLLGQVFGHGSNSSGSFSTFILANGQTVRLNSSADVTDEEIAQLASQETDEGPLVFRAQNGKTYFLLSRPSTEYGLQIVQCEEYGSLVHAVVQAGLLVVLLNGLILIFSIGATHIFSRMIAGDVARAKNFILNGQGSPVPLYFSETQGLLNAYRDVQEKLQAAQDKERQILCQKQEMEMRYMEAQINPHFIFNSLNLISSLALLNNDRTVHEMSTTLAHLLYYNVKGKRIITVREELEQVNRYISIQNMRFPGRFTVRIEVPDPMLDCSILRFVLQPIVENAFLHGLECADGSPHLWIRGAQDGERCLITIENDGVPLSPEFIREFNESILRGEDELYLNKDRRIGIGLTNVYIRLRREYGSNGFIAFRQRPDGKGLAVDIHFLGGKTVEKQPPREG